MFRAFHWLCRLFIVGTLALGGLVTMILDPFLPARPDVMAQVIGEAAELDRLIQRADDAIAHGDPLTAGATIGKAALMASLLAEQVRDTKLATLYHGAEALFRAQENGYRALALFEQAGARPPAPSSACQLLSHAARRREAAATHLARIPAEIIDAMHRNFYRQLLDSAREWQDILDGLRQDLECP